MAKAKGGAMKEEALLTSAKMAQEWGVPAGEVRKAIKQAGVKPDVVKGVCSYYTKTSADKIKKALSKAK